ncbi:uncharacterized protein [Anas platyrhynchos]|uniref:C2H2-type domain-containing protein n=2 Tax=Anas TaxID=8835 RepID=U3IJ42_ANAPP|nr:zinc finger protein 773-like [Anas platyrhynchos]|eukprot:XP_021126279.2 zinc finger protein 773-like isoform X1 [Anas platyrhynchos]
MPDDPNNHMPSEHKLAKALSYWRAPAAACGAMKLMPHLTLRKQRLPRASREGRPLPAAWLKAEPPAAGAPPRPAPTPGLPSPAVPRGQSMQGPGRRGRGAAPGTYRQRLGRARRVPGTWGPCGSLALTHRSLGASCQPRSPVRVKMEPAEETAFSNIQKHGNNFFVGYTGDCILTESEEESDILESHEQNEPLQLPETHSPGWAAARLQQHQRATCNKPAHKARRGSRKLTLIANQQMLHTDEKPYKCTECGKGFKGTTTLLNHMRVHTGEKTFECLECGKRFKRKAGLVVHRRIHTGEKPYKCKECEKSFGCSSNLIAHRKIHAKKKAFSCDTHSQSESTVLSQHQRTHVDEKPCGCAECGNRICPYSGFIKGQGIHVTETPSKNTSGAYCSERTSQQRKEQQRSGTEKLDMDQSDLIFEELKKMRENMDMLLLNQQSQLQVLQQIQKQLNILLPGNDVINSNVYSLGLLLGRQAAAMASLSFPLLNPSSLLSESTHRSSQSSASEILPQHLSLSQHPTSQFPAASTT